MPLNDNRDLASLFTGDATTTTDNAALEVARTLNALNAVEYLHFLMQFAPRHPPSREIPPDHEPFSL